MKLFFCFAILTAVFAAPNKCREQDITVKNQWLLPPTLANANSDCTYMFSFPTDSYAIFTLTVTGASKTDSITVQDYHFDQFRMNNLDCQSNCDIYNLTAFWPDKFYLTYYTGQTTTMRIQMSVVLKKLNLNKNVVGRISTSENSPSSAVHLQSFKPDSSYVFTSSSSNLVLRVPVEYKNGQYTESEESQLSGVFVYDGGRSVGTLAAMRGNGFSSQSNTVTLHSVNSATIDAAVFVTDQTNIGSLDLDVEMASNPPGEQATISLFGTGYPSNKEGIAVLVGEESGKTAITVQQLIALDSGEFTYQFGGPTSAHKNTAIPLSNKDLPKTFSPGQMMTFYISHGNGNVKYTTI